jgi:hypothetical protein
MKKLLPTLMTILTIVFCMAIIVTTDSKILSMLVSIPLNILFLLGGQSLYETVSDWRERKHQIKKKPLGLIKKIKKHKFL